MVATFIGILLGFYVADRLGLTQPLALVLALLLLLLVIALVLALAPLAVPLLLIVWARRRRAQQRGLWLADERRRRRALRRERDRLEARDRAGYGRGVPARVLVAAAEPERIATLVQHLALAPGVEVVGVEGSWFRACSLATLKQADVVLVDADLDGGRGPEAVEAVVREAPAACVIGLGATEAADGRERMIGAGASIIVLRDEPAQEIARTIRRYAAAQAAQELVRPRAASGASTHSLLDALGARVQQAIPARWI